VTHQGKAAKGNFERIFLHGQTGEPGSRSLVTFKEKKKIEKAELAKIAGTETCDWLAAIG